MPVTNTSSVRGKANAHVPLGFRMSTLRGESGSKGPWPYPNQLKPYKFGASPMNEVLTVG